MAAKFRDNGFAYFLCLGIVELYLFVIQSQNKNKLNISKNLIKRNIKVSGSNALILGFTFKENCPDTRNTKVIDVIDELDTYNSVVSVYDPWADKNNVKQKFNINLIETPLENYYDSIILAVGHDYFRNLNIEKIRKKNSVVYDTKSFFSKELVDGQL